jgi:hypothetical protein
MRIRDRLRIDAYGLDNDPPSTVPVERPAQNGIYYGRCQVREIPPPKYEPTTYLWGNKHPAAEITCHRCKKPKAPKRFPFSQRSKAEPWCLACRDKYPQEWAQRTKAIRMKGTKAYRDRQLAALTRRRSR